MDIKTFHHKADLEVNLANDLINCIHHAIEKHGEARILVSGGNTPKHLYQLLSHKNILWDKVTLGLVDERFVPTSDSYSNEKMIRETFMQDFAKEATFIGMVANPENYVENERLVNISYQHFFERLDIILLGMGSDGHVASLFPEDPRSLSILSSSGIGLLNTNTPNTPNRRISCSKSLLLNAPYKFLMITGKEKLDLLMAQRKNLLPIDHFTKEIDNLVTYYSENEH
jgi:6-phosphogluconolactonase